MKIFITLLLLLATTIYAQPTINIGSGNDFKLKKTYKFNSFSNDTYDYFVFNTTENYLKVPTVITADKKGNIQSVNTIQIPSGSYTNMNEIIDIKPLGEDKTAVFIQNMAKNENLNKLFYRAMNVYGTLDATEVPIASFEFKGRMNSGYWYIEQTPDKKHIAVIAQLPTEKNTPTKFKYYYLNNNFKQELTGEFSFPTLTKELRVQKFYVSNKGDFYLVSSEYDKYYYPVVHQASINNTTGSIMPIKLEDPALRISNYISTFTADGNLLLAGYIEKKSTVSFGNNIESKGYWIYNASASTQIKTQLFEKPMQNMTAKGLLLNNGTLYLIGENFRSEKKNTYGATAMGAEEVFTYYHKDILVSALDVDGNKKFEIPLTRNFTTTGNDDTYAISSNILNNKLVLVYNDEYSKYFPTEYNFKTPIPVLVSITNDGLMEAPANYERELQTTKKYFMLYPQLNLADASHFSFLLYEGSVVKGVVFK